VGRSTLLLPQDVAVAPALTLWRRVVTAAITAVAAFGPYTGVAGAQIMRRAPVQSLPSWIGGGVVISRPYVLRDGITGAEWAFASNRGYTALFEIPDLDGTAGLQATYATTGLTYTALPGGSPPGAPCQTGCDATGTVVQLMGLMHSANAPSFHQVYQMTIGATGYTNFKQVSTGAKIGPEKIDYDLAVAVGYGIGLGLSSAASIEMLQEVGTVRHQRTGLAAGTGGYPRILTTRFVGKISF